MFENSVIDHEVEVHNIDPDLLRTEYLSSEIQKNYEHRMLVSAAMVMECMYYCTMVKELRKIYNLDTRIGIIGCGNMGTDIVDALLKLQFDPKKIRISSRNHEYLLQESSYTKHGIQLSYDNKAAIHASDMVIVCVAPYQQGTMQFTGQNISEGYERKFFVSLLPGMSDVKLAAGLQTEILISIAKCYDLAKKGYKAVPEDTNLNAMTLATQTIECQENKQIVSEKFQMYRTRIAAFKNVDIELACSDEIITNENVAEKIYKIYKSLNSIQHA